MAKKKGDEEEGKKKKPIVPIILVVGGLFAGKTFFGGGAPAKTPEQIEAEHAAAEAELLKTCQEANGIVAEGEGHAPAGGGHSTTAAEETSHESTSESHSTDMHETDSGGEGESLELVNLSLIAATRPRQGGGGAVSSVPPVLELDSVTVNLADGHYLMLGLALQLKVGMTAEAASKEGLGARALDMALERLSAKEMPELISAEARAAIKQQLGLDTCLAYEGEVTTVYFTEFVMQ